MATNDVVAQTEDILNIKDIEDAKATISKYARKTPLIQWLFVKKY